MCVLRDVSICHSASNCQSSVFISMENFRTNIYNDLSPSQIDVITALNKYKVKFIIIGGYALRYLGYFRETADLDIITSSEVKNVENLCNALSELGAKALKQAKKKLLKPKGKINFYDVEILTPKPDWNFDEIYSRSITESFNGLTFYFLCMSDMISLKEGSDRPKDKQDLTNLKKMLSKNDIK